MVLTLFAQCTADVSRFHIKRQEYFKFALLQNCIIKLICFILILISASTSLFHDFKATIFVFKNHYRITIRDFC